MSPIAQAVEPLRQDAMASATEYARKLAATMAANIEHAGWDINVAYPHPRGTLGRAEYKRAAMLCQLAQYFTKTDEVKHSVCRRPSDPHYVVLDQAGIDRYVEEARKDASAQYDLFIAKLEEKVGAHSGATLNGNHVWGHSILMVVTPSGIQHWKTQQIINTSVLGKVFNQWPTRLVK